MTQSMSKAGYPYDNAPMERYVRGSGPSGVIFDYYLMPLTSQIRNFMLNRRTQWVILLLRS